MRKILSLLLLLIGTQVQAQIIGKVTNTNNEDLPYVNIYVKSTYTGTTSNDEGNYELNVGKKANYTIVYQFIGYKTVTKKVTIERFPHILNISLEAESTSLDEVVINNKEDPANRIIRATIAQRKENLARISEYTADFYSRGVWKLKNAPKKILGQTVQEFEGILDSTRSGIIYLSETISKISYQQPNDFNEHIIASKISGNDNGFSFNSAQDATFSFYENTIKLNTAIVSPIASNAFNYYDYKLDGIFYEGSKLINKIKVIPKRPNDRVFKGVIYIVEDDWQLYGVDISTTGAALQIPFIKELVFKQNFKYDATQNFWVKISQTIDFGFGFMGLKGDGRNTSVYSNYDFEPVFKKRSFSNEVLSFEPEANKKDRLFWNAIRPVPLTNEELNDYIKKDSIQELKKSKPYLDSLDLIANKFRITDPLLGYTYRNTSNKWRLSYKGPAAGISFNTIQGYTSKIGVTFFKWYTENRTKWLSMNLNATYGLAEDRLRFTGGITKKFNSKNNLKITLSGGTKLTHFNDSEPISPLINSISTLFYESNYLKGYALDFVQIKYQQELFNGLEIFAKFGYEKRSTLFNNTAHYIINNENLNYSSNNPLAPKDFTTKSVERHQVFKSQITARVIFGQKYISIPDRKINIGNQRYPRIDVTVENGLGASKSNYNYTQLRTEIYQNFSVANKGEFYYRVKAGTFFNAGDISFIEYQHFNGNQTKVGTSSNYTNVFNALPYYDLSTNKRYMEGHVEHDFKGWILGKIPGINTLNFNLVFGAHFLATETRKPYSEFSVGIDNLGFGSYRLLRIDYVRSNFNGIQNGNFIFGLKFLGLFGL
jgi:hypothetical protein